jgi:GNAT superfamily N-acetyltransferase
MINKERRMKYTIRLAIETDNIGISDVSKYLGYSELSRVEAKEKIRQVINSSWDEVFVAELNGQLVGWLHLFYARRLASADFFEIGGLVVNPDFRGQGIGRHLVNHVLDKHKEKVRVRCNEARTESHMFYQAIGFNSKKVQRVFEVRS